MNDSPTGRRTRFDKNEPDGISSHEDEMDWEKGSAGSVGKQDKTHADDEVDEAGANIEKPVTVIDGEDAPLGRDDKNEADDATTGNDGSTNRKHSESKI